MECFDTDLRTSVASRRSELGVHLQPLGAGTAWAYQTHMFYSRNDFGQAQHQLQTAIPDKDGHRVSAINLVQQAINEVDFRIQAGAQ